MAGTRDYQKLLEIVTPNSNGNSRTRKKRVTKRIEYTECWMDIFNAALDPRYKTPVGIVPESVLEQVRSDTSLVEKFIEMQNEGIKMANRIRGNGGNARPEYVAQFKLGKASANRFLYLESSDHNNFHTLDVWYRDALKAGHLFNMGKQVQASKDSFHFAGEAVIEAFDRLNSLSFIPYNKVDQWFEKRDEINKYVVGDNAYSDTIPFSLEYTKKDVLKYKLDLLGIGNNL